MKSDCNKCLLYFGKYKINCTIYPDGKPEPVCPYWEPFEEKFFKFSEVNWKKNLENYGINLADASTVLSDPKALTIEDFDNGKFVSVTLGMSAISILLVVVHESSEQAVEVLAARLATEREQSSYQSV
jgi:uncharacterized DUF497 family protein